jgi:hypothetical protein
LRSRRRAAAGDDAACFHNLRAFEIKVTDSLHASHPAMEGDGFYNRHSTLQAAGIEKLLPIWREAVARTDFGDGAPAIADYGSSQGHNSMAPMAVAIETIRRRLAAQTPISIVHTDLPENDYASLFRTLTTANDSYLRLGGELFFSAVGRSYFEQILPPNSVDLGWNSWTLQWMSRNPAEDPDFLYGAYSPSQAVREAVDRQLAEDWRSFLRLRALELKPGGVLLSSFVAKIEGVTSWEWVAEQLWLCILDMRREGLLSDAETLRINFPVAPRDLAAIEAPFDADRMFSGLRLEYADLLHLPDPFFPAYRESGDATVFAEEWKNMVQAVFAPTVKSALDPVRDASGVAADLFDRLGRRIAAAPQPVDHFLGVALVRKAA